MFDSSNVQLVVIYCISKINVLLGYIAIFFVICRLHNWWHRMTKRNKCFLNGLGHKETTYILHSLHVYSESCNVRPPYGTKFCGPKWQVVSHLRYQYIEMIDLDTFRMVSHWRSVSHRSGLTSQVSLYNILVWTFQCLIVPMFNCWWFIDCISKWF